MSVLETYKIAHTARCKLRIAADRPDRDLRFILGHAFTLDKMLLRIAEIEISGSIDSDSDSDSDPKGDLSMFSIAAAPERQLNFKPRALSKPGEVRSSNRSPPPPLHPDEDSDSDDAYKEDDGEEEDGLGLMRFDSAAAQSPQIAEDLKGLSEEDLQALIEGEDNEELKDMYQHVVGCACHGVIGPVAERVWEVPSSGIQGAPRMALVAVAA